MLETLVQQDKELFLFLNNLGSSTWDGFWMFITNKWSSVPLYLLLAYLCYLNFGWKRTLGILLTIALLILVTDQFANFLKNGVQRLRPCFDPEINDLMRLVKKSCGGRYGYFSAHAANSTAVAFFFTKLFRKKYKLVGFFLFIWAILVAYSRIYIGVHFPLDVFSGIAIGLFLSWLCSKLYIFALHKYRV